MVAILFSHKRKEIMLFTTGYLFSFTALILVLRAVKYMPCEADLAHLSDEDAEVPEMKGSKDT